MSSLYFKPKLETINKVLTPIELSDEDYKSPCIVEGKFFTSVKLAIPKLPYDRAELAEMLLNDLVKDTFLVKEEHVSIQRFYYEDSNDLESVKISCKNYEAIDIITKKNGTVYVTTKNSAQRNKVFEDIETALSNTLTLMGVSNDFDAL